MTKVIEQEIPIILLVYQLKFTYSLLVVTVVVKLPIENDTVARSIASNIFSHVTLSLPCNHLINKSIQHPSAFTGWSCCILSNSPGCTSKNTPIFFQWAAYEGRTYLHKSLSSGRSGSINGKLETHCNPIEVTHCICHS